MGGLPGDWRSTAGRGGLMSRKTVFGFADISPKMANFIGKNGESFCPLASVRSGHKSDFLWERTACATPEQRS